MSVDAALNLLWVVLGTLALAGTFRAQRHHLRHNSSRLLLQLCGVGLIVAALFPYISATDDVLRVQHLYEQSQTSSSDDGSGKRGPSDSLIRLYETADAPLVAEIHQTAVTLFFFALVVLPVLRGLSRSAPFQLGRSPPLLRKH